MKKTEVNLEMMINAYAKSTGKDGLFISILEANDNLAKLLDLTGEEMVQIVYGYLYITDFANFDEMEMLFNKIIEESHSDAQYMVLVKSGEIVKEYPEW